MKEFVVLRNCPPELSDYEGRWYGFEEPWLQFVMKVAPTPILGYGSIIRFQGTGRFEMREDGERAEVFEPCEPPT